MFELGFFSPGKSKNRYLGIWYKKSAETVVWVANRNNPIIEPHGVLTICNDGSLVILNKTEGIIWSSNTSRRMENPVAQLLDTGNLVVRNNFSMNTSESYVWQSFDYPSDTLLPGMKLGWDLKTGLERHLTSWRSADDPSPGEYTFRLDISILPQLSLYRRSVKLSRRGPWNGVNFMSIPSDPNFSFDPILEDNQDEIYYMYESYNNPTVMLLKLNYSGKMQRLIWKERSSEWKVEFSKPAEDSCEYYMKCGANTVCSINKTPICKCLKGFKPKSQYNGTWPTTCVTNSALDCKSEDRFVNLSGIELPDLLKVSLNKSMNLKECEAECLRSCSCRAYANSNVTGGGSGCLMWFGDLIDIKRITDGMDIYIRMPACKPGKKKLLLAVVIVVSLMVLLPAFYFLCYRRRKLKKKGNF
ncbi:G-type lectin S-receptor-like serine/threonine-protein kinase At4g27290 [Pistacia vera]|uniref:G-type lectin S-receptor-like serine/threonine-protein kinase At4g27290 n=1 Tax=Pistacia vera TaxID=55513 RepID=UPI0012632562|nr:G-type lectin S-receptor-like serine/threonine-protein kinase At4g27290 [Pistacia vera]